MKPGYEKIIDQPNASFTARMINRDNRPLLRQAWHFHPEIEICYTVKSNGRRFVGNQINDYVKGDLVLFGTNLPHGFTTDQYSSQIVIQMTADFLGPQFLARPELKNITTLFNRARQGLVYTEDVRKPALRLMRKILATEGMDKLLILLQLLHLLAESNHAHPICSKAYALDFQEAQLGRIKIVYDHIMEHFTDDVSIKVVADKLNITEAAFYKFIKKQTQKTYTQIINEFRINYAGKLLMTTDKSIGEICYISGYNNLSYFNRKFKQIMNCTPEDFRGKYANR